MKQKKTFEQLVAENPDSFDYQDCRSGPPRLPQAYIDAITPEHVRKRIAQRKAMPWKTSRVAPPDNAR